jgi:hypothetical protein
MDAQRKLNRLWADTGGPASIVSADQRFIDIMRSGTSADLADYLSDEFESVDHRPLGMGRRDRGAWLESVRDFVGSSESVYNEYLETAGTTRLYRGELWSRDGDVILDGISLSSQDADGRLERFELFGHDQFADARTRFQELTATPTRGDADDAVARDNRRPAEIRTQDGSIRRREAQQVAASPGDPASTSESPAEETSDAV